MDGPFFSLYPLNDTCDIYSLTHVLYTPINNNENFNLTSIKNNIENDVIKYLPDFFDYFEYDSYFLSNKTKINNDSKNDSRECIIENNKNIISVNCGKICGIFIFEEYLKTIFDI